MGVAHPGVLVDPPLEEPLLAQPGGPFQSVTFQAAGEITDVTFEPVDRHAAGPVHERLGSGQQLGAVVVVELAGDPGDRIGMTGRHRTRRQGVVQCGHRRAQLTARRDRGCFT